jgi:hypothetical protein
VPKSAPSDDRSSFAHSEPDVPWDVITFRRRAEAGSSVEITIDRAKLARFIARRAAANASGKFTTLLGSIAAVILPDAPAE